MPNYAFYLASLCPVLAYDFLASVFLDCIPVQVYVVAYAYVYLAYVFLDCVCVPVKLIH